MKSCLTCKHYYLNEEGLKCPEELRWVNGTAQAEDCGFYEERELSP